MAGETTTIAIEHALIMVMVLYVLLSKAGKHLAWVAAFIAGGIGLSLFTPFHSFQPAWNVIHMLALPFLIWESAIRIARDQGRPALRGLLGIGVIVALLAVVLTFLGNLPLATSLLLAFLAASIVWRLRPDFHKSSYIGGVGLLILAILLVEVDLWQTGGRALLRQLLTGLALGIPLGILYFSGLRRIGRRHLGGGGIYAVLLLAFGIGQWAETSSIFVMFAAALYIMLYGYSTGVWRTTDDIPVYFESPISLVLLGVAWLLLGWEAHVNFDVRLVAPVLAGIVVLPIGILIARAILPLDDADDGSNSWLRMTIMVVEFLFLIAGVLFLWPAELNLNTAQVEIAIGTAILLLVIIRMVLPVGLEMFQISLRWPEAEK